MRDGTLLFPTDIRHFKQLGTITRPIVRMVQGLWKESVSKCPVFYFTTRSSVGECNESLHKLQVDSLLKFPGRVKMFEVFKLHWLTCSTLSNGKCWQEGLTIFERWQLKLMDFSGLEELISFMRSCYSPTNYNYIHFKVTAGSCPAQPAPATSLLCSQHFLIMVKSDFGIKWGMIKKIFCMFHSHHIIMVYKELVSDSLWQFVFLGPPLRRVVPGGAGRSQSGKWWSWRVFKLMLCQEKMVKLTPSTDKLYKLTPGHLSRNWVWQKGRRNCIVFNVSDWRRTWEILNITFWKLKI